MKPSRLTLAIVAAVTLAGVVAACDDSSLLEVDAPSRIPARNLEDPVNAPILLNGAIADFECAFGAYTVVGGLIGEELEDATQTADRYPYDRRTITSADIRYQTSECDAIGVYTPLQRARVSANNIRRLLEGWTDAQVPDRQLRLATAAAYEAYSMLLFGEGFCATAFSHFNPDGTVAYGGEITAQQALDSAITRFDQAIQVATTVGTSAQDILNLARVGRARAKLDKGDLTGARSDAAAVPPAFQYNVTGSISPSRRVNRVWANTGLAGGGAVNSAASVGEPYRNLNDPRVPVQNTGQIAAGTRVPIWAQTKYGSGAAPIPLATGDEARLIVAEADITANPGNALLIINEFRARGNRGPLVAPTAAELRAALIEERRRELFLESHHLGDLIRYQQPLNPAAGTTFPGGGTYGSQRCMPLPDVEKLNNPQLAGS